VVGLVSTTEFINRTQDILSGCFWFWRFNNSRLFAKWSWRKPTAL